MKDPEILSVDELKEGQIIRGYVRSVEKSGVFIRSDICFNCSIHALLLVFI